MWQVFRAAVAQVPFSQPMGFVAQLLEKPRQQRELCRQPYLSISLLYTQKNKKLVIDCKQLDPVQMCKIYIYRFKGVLRDELEAGARCVPETSSIQISDKEVS